MREKSERVKLREDVRDFLLNCGSEFVTTNQVTTELRLKSDDPEKTNAHTPKIILSQFKQHDLVTSKELAPNSNNPVTIWSPNKTALKKADFSELTKIKKPKLKEVKKS